MKLTNTYSTLPMNFYSEECPAKVQKPELILINNALQSELELELPLAEPQKLADIFSGQTLLPGSNPISMAYAAHQFGHFVPLLGDGRAMLLGEIKNSKGHHFDIQLKGAGRTSYSRGGDGKSALGPVLREYIVSEAMHHLGVPTTRALAAVSTGDLVYRETALPGAILTRVAKSHLRIGSFQFFACRGDRSGLISLLNFCIDRHYKEINSFQENPDDSFCRSLLFLKEVIKSQIDLVVNWMCLGFIHGVMNTDNTSISGETLDYGPCAFMDSFNFDQTYSYIDKNGRYSYKNQEGILKWNLARLAECFLILTDKEDSRSLDILNAEIDSIPQLYLEKYCLKMSEKLGLFDSKKNNNIDLITMWLNYLESKKLDFTLSFRNLAESLTEAGDISSNSYFKDDQEFQYFLELWLPKLKAQGINFSLIKERMNKVNPLYIPRNHQIQKAIDHAHKGDYSIFLELNELLKNPYTHQPKRDSYKEAPLPSQEIKATFCGT